MGEEPKGLLSRLWRGAWVFLASMFALWLGVRLLLDIWWVLLICAGLIIGLAVLIRWWRYRRWP